MAEDVNEALSVREIVARIDRDMAEAKLANRRAQSEWWKIVIAAAAAGGVLVKLGELNIFG